MAKLVKLETVQLIENECQCENCKEACRTRPCWPTPAEVEKLIDAGHGPMLMVDWWGTSAFYDVDQDILVLCPAGQGREGADAAELRTWLDLEPQPCVMHTPEGLCKLHGPLKPTEGRYGGPCEPTPGGNIHGGVADSWNNPEALRLVHRWMQLVNYQGKYKREVEKWITQNPPAAP
jgi:hypothetical protein